MKDFLVFLPIAIVSLAIKTTIFPNFPFPDIPLLMVFYLAYSKPSVEGAVFAFVIGFVDDAFSGSVIGSASFALVIIYACVFLLSKLLQVSTPATKAGGAAAAAVIKGLLTYYVLKFAHISVSFLATVILQALATGIFAPFVFTFLQKVSSYLGHQSFKDNES